jgi:hypothetical protein
MAQNASPTIVAACFMKRFYDVPGVETRRSGGAASAGTRPRTVIIVASMAAMGSGGCEIRWVCCARGRG